MSIDTDLETQDLDTTTTETEGGAEPNLREVLEQSFTKVSTDSSATAPGEETPAAKAERLRDEEGRFAKGKPVPAKVAVPTSAPAKGQAGAPAPKPPAAATQEGAPPAKAPAAEPLKAPASWKPEAREAWAGVPPAVQAEIHRREVEQQRFMQSTANERKVAGDLRDVIAPYAGMIQAEGSHPMQTVQRLLQTAAALRTAPPAHKAELLGTIAETYGIDLNQVVAAAVKAGKLRVEGLDNAIAAALEGKTAPQQGPAFDPAAFKQQVRQEILGELGQRGEAAATKQSAREVESFMAGKEFAADVREAMADYIEVRERRGLPTTLEQAYNYACSADEGISKVLSQRAAAKSAATATAATQRTKAAASSVKSQPTPRGAGKAPTNLRESLDAAWEAHSST